MAGGEHPEHRPSLTTATSRTWLWLVLGSGCLVSIFPESEEIFVGSTRTTRAASASAHCKVLACSAFARTTPRCAKAPAVVENFLELGGGFHALSCREICFRANVGRIEAGEILDKENLAYSMGVRAACRRFMAALVSSRLSANCSDFPIIPWATWAPSMNT